MTTFWLGTHRPDWLAHAGVPLMVSHRTLLRRRSLPIAAAPWALDSGGFSELSLYGRWVTTAGTYVAAVRRYAAGCGQLAWAAPQDWMCEPVMLAATGADVATHQRRTIASVLELRALAPELPWVPVLQGWAADDYLRHADAYAAAGIDLAAEPLVGVGSVCRRQHSGEISVIVERLAGLGLALHGFGVKVRGLRDYGGWLASADSLAWSFDARRAAPLPGCTHARCNNCLRYALRWRAGVLDTLARRPVRLWEPGIAHGV